MSTRKYDQLVGGSGPKDCLVTVEDETGRWITVEGHGDTSMDARDHALTLIDRRTPFRYKTLCCSDINSIWKSLRGIGGERRHIQELAAFARLAHRHPRMDVPPARQKPRSKPGAIKRTVSQWNPGGRNHK